MMLISSLPTGAFNVVANASSFYYTYTVSGGKATITKCHKSINGNVTIPSVLGAYEVVAIGDSALKDCASIKTIKIPETITQIGNYAFQGCGGMTKITIPKSIRGIGVSAFNGCFALNEVNIENIEFWLKIGFSNAQSNPLNINKNTKLLVDGNLLTDIIVPESVTEIKNYAFSGLEHLETIKIPFGINRIGSYSFNGCKNLNYIEILEEISGYSMSICDYAFNNCNNLKYITINEKISYNIGKYAFQNCISLTALDKLGSVYEIGEYAFSGCKNITNIIVPDTVHNIGQAVFMGCSNVECITLPFVGASRTNQSFIGHIFGSSIFLPGNNIYDNITYVPKTLKTVILSEGCNYLNQEAFLGNETIEKIILPSTICNEELFNGDTFICLSNLKEINISAENNQFCSKDGVVFSKNGKKLIFCPPKRDIPIYHIPDGTEEICSYAFFFPNSLTGITVPDSIINIENDAFMLSDNILLYCNIGNTSKLISSLNYKYKYLGDLNNDKTLNSLDVIMMRKGLLNILNCDNTISDYNRDNNFDVLDLIRLKKKFAGIIA